MALPKIEGGTWFVMGLLAVVGLFLAGQFTEVKTCTQAMVDADEHGCTTTADTYRAFTVPGSVELNKMPISIVKIIVLMAISWAAVALALSFSGKQFTRAHFITVIIIAVMAWLLWDNVIVKLFDPGMASIDDITFAVGQKLGVLK